ncbi:uncharacterized protein ASPGLDRAFT_1505476 [Aspergillus glaucus CBS 516.65]|uniref:Calcineurin-like phosphoesterase domain-containing protein n=1 Tax=Aspergillus glaucus CBS 516.65 TaxID=1160497 RepID=A0A1L9VV81_ASPGL|nr:hypothetical protein ASPGLDRAFT_1505476 [Aspergillus glaucus CBS 516.65]OJJ87811.1 hypothetical protein ASPGLDRAFT_1505476 [Aspergillus glaucus CBS 516.65]
MTRVYFQIIPNLALLGDIGHVADPQLFTFLEDQLSHYSIVFYLLGNHDPYHMSFQLARKKMREFQAKVDKRKIMLRKFAFLDQTRFYISDGITILGCTLFSHVPPHQEFAVEIRLVDFRGILRWDVDEHNAAHESDLNWLNDQVGRMAVDEPHRRICWRAFNVVAWAFGHMHHNCEFRDEGGKTIMTNQKGYYMYPKKTFVAGRVFTVGE